MKTHAPMKAHGTDKLSLGFGLAFLAALAWWLFGHELSIPLPQAGWIIAIALILLGVLGLAGALRSGRDHEPEVESPDELS
jgi:hypothetical protein